MSKKIILKRNFTNIAEKLPNYIVNQIKSIFDNHSNSDWSKKIDCTGNPTLFNVISVMHNINEFKKLVGMKYLIEKPINFYAIVRTATAKETIINELLRHHQFFTDKDLSDDNAIVRLGNIGNVVFYHCPVYTDIRKYHVEVGLKHGRDIIIQNTIADGLCINLEFDREVVKDYRLKDNGKDFSKKFSDKTTEIIKNKVVVESELIPSQEIHDSAKGVDMGCFTVYKDIHANSGYPEAISNRVGGEFKFIPAKENPIKNEIRVDTFTVSPNYQNHPDNVREFSIDVAFADYETKKRAINAINKNLPLPLAYINLVKGFYIREESEFENLVRKSDEAVLVHKLEKMLFLSSLFTKNEVYSKSEVENLNTYRVTYINHEFIHENNIPFILIKEDEVNFNFYGNEIRDKQQITNISYTSLLELVKDFKTKAKDHLIFIKRVTPLEHVEALSPSWKYKNEYKVKCYFLPKTHI